MNPKGATLAAGLVLGIIAGQSLGLFGIGAPSIFAPAPMLLVFPLFFGLPFALVIGLFVLLFWMWHPRLFTGATDIPARTIVLIAAATVLSVLAFVTGWQYAVRYQGYRYAVICLIASGLLLVACVISIWSARRNPSFRASLASHTLLFVWLGSYALPYMGETP
jgi:hypothetical protein